MQLRPFAPLAVIGAGLLVMTLATYPASAQDGGAPVDVSVTPVGSDLLVSWQAPDSTDGLSEYDLQITDPETGKHLLDRSFDPVTVTAKVGPEDLRGAKDLVVTVLSAYGQASRYAGTSVRVSLPTGPEKPETPPTVRVEGRLLTAKLPKAADGVTGRIVQVLQDGVLWKTLSLKATRTSLTRKVPAGHEYAIAYQEVSEVAAGPFSEPSASVTVKTVGPTAVKEITLRSVHDGLRVRWSAALPQGADLQGYRIKVAKDGVRVGSAYTAGGVQSVVLPGGATDGVYTVTVTATDAAGGASSTTALSAAG